MIYGKTGYLIITFLMLTIIQPASASVRSDVSGGNKLYGKNKYKEALQKYAGAQVQAPDEPRIMNNMGITSYKQSRYDQSRDDLLRANTSARLSDKERSIINYNLGNTYYKAGKNEEAIQAYKAAIDLDNTNEDAKYNLGFVRKKMKNDQNRNNEKKDNKKQGNNKKDNNTGKNDKNKPGNNQMQAEKRQDKNRQDISREDAERILNSLAKEEKNPARPAGEQQGGVNGQKDW